MGGRITFKCLQNSLKKILYCVGRYFRKCPMQLRWILDIDGSGKLCVIPVSY